MPPSPLTFSYDGASATFCALSKTYNFFALFRVFSPFSHLSPHYVLVVRFTHRNLMDFQCCECEFLIRCLFLFFLFYSRFACILQSASSFAYKLRHCYAMDVVGIVVQHPHAAPVCCSHFYFTFCCHIILRCMGRHITCRGSEYPKMRTRRKKQNSIHTHTHQIYISFIF